MALEVNKLIVLKDKYLNSLESKLNKIILKRSNNSNKLLRTNENLTIWDNFLNTELNKLSKDFVNSLNSDNLKIFSLEEREKINSSFRSEVKQLILKYNRKFLLNE
jgi:hypothetical protein